MVQVAEKSLFWCTLRYTGTPGHASVPYRADNALVKAAEAGRRLAAGAPGPQMTSPWQQLVTSLGLAGDLAETLTDPAKVDALLPALDSGLARFVHACTHCTIAPTVLQAGVKANAIPEHAALTLDIRALPGWDEDKIRTMLAGILGDLWDDTAVEIFDGGASAPSPVSTPLWESLQRAADRLTPGDQNVPFLQPGITDGRFFRRLGATAYGYQLFSDRIGFDQMVAMFHGDNERVDLETLRLSTELWLYVAQDLLS